MSVQTETLAVRGALAALSAGAAALHVAVAPEHLSYHWTMGTAFFTAAALQLLWAVLLLVRPGRAVIVLGAIGQGLAVPVYLVVHEVGWPFGAAAWQPEPHTAAGVVVCALEAAAALGVMAFAPWQRPVVPLRTPRLVLPMVGLLVAGLTGGTVLLGGTEGQHGHGHDGTVLAAGVEAEDGHGHGSPADTAPPTDAQKAAADRLLQQSRKAMTRYADVAAAKAAGYKVIHNANDRLLHYGSPAFMRDGRTLDPSRIESLLYVRVNAGHLLVGGMYMAPTGQSGPRVGGSLTPWHAHDDLCLDPRQGVAITPTADGCPAGSAVGVTGEMMHVWAIDYPGGPFAELDAAALRTAVMQYYGIGSPS